MAQWEYDATKNGKIGEGLVESVTDAAKGLWNAVTNPLQTVVGISNAFHDPVGTVTGMVNDAKATFKADPEKFAGKVLGNVLMSTATAGVANEVKAVSKVDDVAKLGDLLTTEVKQIQKVVDNAGRPLEVVGSAAQGTRRGVGSNLPIGKGPGTKSDIDYLVPPSSMNYYSGMGPNLPSIDPKSGIIPGVHNPHMGPAVRFAPGETPVYIKQQTNITN